MAQVKSPKFILLHTTSPRHEVVYINPDHIISLTAASENAAAVILKIQGYDSPLTIEGTPESILKMIEER